MPAIIYINVGFDFIKASVKLALMKADNLLSSCDICMYVKNVAFFINVCKQGKQ